MQCQDCGGVMRPSAFPGSDRSDHVVLWRMRARRYGVAVMALKLKITVQARVSGKVEGKAGNGNGIVDDNVANAHAVHSNRSAGIDVFAERTQKSGVGGKPNLDLSQSVLDPRHGSDR